MPGRSQRRLFENQPGHLIRRAHQRSTAVFMEETREFDITPPQYAALTAIAENAGVDGVTLSELIAFDRATVGSILDRLEAKGLVVRTPHATDRRVKENTVTKAGKRLLDQMARVMPRVAALTFNGLNDDEQQRLLVLLQRVAEGPSAK